jgi:hypothetical protein
MKTQVNSDELVAMEVHVAGKLEDYCAVVEQLEASMQRPYLCVTSPVQKNGRDSGPTKIHPMGFES